MLYYLYFYLLLKFRSIWDKFHELFLIGSRRVGIVGYLTPKTKQISLPENLIFLDEIEALKQVREGVNKNITKLFADTFKKGIFSNYFGIQIRMGINI